MLNLTPEEQKFIRENLPNGEELVNTEDVNDIILALDDWIVGYGMDEVYALTPAGRKAERMLDNILYNNTDDDDDDE